MARKYPANWQDSEATKKAKPGFGKDDTRIMHGGKAKGIAIMGDKKAPGISLTGK